MSTSLFKAAVENDSPKIRELLAISDPNASTFDSGWTPLHFAAHHNSVEAAQLLLAAGAKPGALSHLSETPLHLVTGVEVARLLLATAVDRSVRDQDGLNPADRALKSNLASIFKLVAEASPELGTPNYQLLRYAWRHGLVVEAKIDNQRQQFSVVKLGWGLYSERCLAWQTGVGWMRLKPARLRDLVLTGFPSLDGPSGLKNRPRWVQILDKGETKPPGPRRRLRAHFRARVRKEDRAFVALQKSLSLAAANSLVICTRKHFPMGHGAFHCGDIGDFLYVYDCGSVSKSKAERRVEVDRFWETNKGRELNALYLSHLHRDHTNSVEELLLEDGQLRPECKNTCVFLPYVAPDLRLSLLALSRPSSDFDENLSWSQFVREPASWLQALGITAIVYVHSLPGKDSEPEVREMGVPWNLTSPLAELLSVATGPPPAVKEAIPQSVRFLESGRPLKLGVWQVCLFVDSTIVRLEASELELLSKRPSISHATGLQDWMKSVRMCYKKAALDRLNRGTMCLFSGPLNGEDLMTWISIGNSSAVISRRVQPGPVGWLATGDLDLKESAGVWGEFGEFLQRFDGSIATVTIPHHGSVHNSDRYLFERTRAQFGLVSMRPKAEAVVINRIRNSVGGSTYVFSLARECVTEIIRAASSPAASIIPDFGASKEEGVEASREKAAIRLEILRLRNQNLQPRGPWGGFRKSELSKKIKVTETSPFWQQQISRCLEVKEARGCRVHYPMGHGGFHSGHVFFDEPETGFSYVYDCGSRSLTREARAELVEEFWALMGHGFLDALFLSHFDIDHINGLEDLLLRDGKLRDACRNICVFLPYFTPELRLRLLFLYKDLDNLGFWTEFVRDPAKWLLGVGVKWVVYVHTYPDIRDLTFLESRTMGLRTAQLLREASSTAPIEISEFSPNSGVLFQQAGKNITLAESYSSKGPPLQWILSPHTDDLLRTKTQEGNGQFDLDWPSSSKPAAEFIQWVSKMKSEYKRVFRQKVNRASMCLYSGPGQDSDCDWSFRQLPVCEIAGSAFAQPEMHEFIGNGGGWLGTGDAELLGKGPGWNSFSEYINNLQLKSLPIISLTVPHHGSKNNSDSRLFDTLRPQLSMVPVKSKTEGAVLDYLRGFSSIGRLLSLTDQAIVENLVYRKEY